MKRYFYTFLVLLCFVSTSVFAGGISTPPDTDRSEDVSSYEDLEEKLDEEMLAPVVFDDLSEDIASDVVELLTEEIKLTLSQELQQELAEQENPDIPDSLTPQTEDVVSLAPELVFEKKEEFINFESEDERIALDEVVEEMEVVEPTAEELDVETTAPIRTVKYTQVQPGDTMGVLMKTLTGHIDWDKLENTAPLEVGEYIWFTDNDEPVVSDSVPLSGDVVVRTIRKKDEVALSAGDVVDTDQQDTDTEEPLFETWEEFVELLVREDQGKSDVPDDSVVTIEEGASEVAQDTSPVEAVEIWEALQDVDYAQVKSGDTLGSLMKQLTGTIDWTKLIGQVDIHPGQFVWFDAQNNVYISDVAPDGDLLIRETKTVEPTEEKLIEYIQVLTGDTLGELMKKLTGRIIWRKLAGQPAIHPGQYVWFDEQFNVYISNDRPDGSVAYSAETNIDDESVQEDVVESSVRDALKNSLESEIKRLREAEQSGSEEWYTDSQLWNDIDVLIAYVKKDIENLRQEDPLPLEKIIAQQKMLEILQEMKSKSLEPFEEVVEEPYLDDKTPEISPKADVFKKGLVWAIGLILLILIVRVATRKKK